MNDVNIATYDVNDPEMPLDSMAGPTGPAVRKQTLRYSENQPCFEARADRQAREEQDFYIPDFLSDEHYDANPQAYAAAEDHARHLRNGERLLDEALNLVKLLLASLGDESDSRAMQTETALKVVEKKLNKAYGQIDRHDTCQTKLFLAYFDLKAKADGVAE